MTGKKPGSYWDFRQRSSVPKDTLAVPPSHSDVSVAEVPSSDVTRDDIEREKKNLNLDSFIRCQGYEKRFATCVNNKLECLPVKRVFRLV
jgi:hypothetical protein